MRRLCEIIYLEESAQLLLRAGRNDGRLDLARREVMKAIKEVAFLTAVCEARDDRERGISNRGSLTTSEHEAWAVLYERVKQLDILVKKEMRALGPSPAAKIILMITACGLAWTTYSVFCKIRGSEQPENPLEIVAS